MRKTGVRPSPGAASFDVPKVLARLERENRSSKSEIRKKSEGRNPKPESLWKSAKQAKDAKS